MDPQNRTGHRDVPAAAGGERAAKVAPFDASPEGRDRSPIPRNNMSRDRESDPSEHQTRRTIVLKLYDHPLSPYAQKVKLAMYEKGIEFESKMPNILAGGDPEFHKTSPRREVPSNRAR